MAAVLSAAEIEAIRSDPAQIVDAYNEHRTVFLSDLGLPGLDEAVYKAAWSTVVAYKMAPYGSGDPSSLASLLASPTLDCASYVTLTWHFLQEFGPSDANVSAVGWYDGAVGNHSSTLR